jgi:hypothetical protein
LKVSSVGVLASPPSGNICCTALILYERGVEGFSLTCELRI